MARLERSHGSTPEDPLLFCVELEEGAPREKASEPIGFWKKVGRKFKRGFGCKGSEVFEVETD